jgi:YaiO family outer membrane protein
MRQTRSVYFLLLLAMPLYSQLPDTGGAAAQTGSPPIRLEVGGYGNDFSGGAGWWRGFDTTIWLRENPKFVPSFTFDQRSSDAGTQRYYSFFSYANWTANFYTTQGIGGVPVVPGSPLLFPRFRIDFKPWWKIPPSRQLVAGLGATKFSFSGGQRGFILNPGLLYYRRSWVFDWEAFANLNQLGGFWSGAGQFSVQQGHEGRYWIGATVGAGKQVYRELATTPLDVRFSSTSVDVFYRRWLTRNFGFVAAGGYLDAYNTYRRATASASFFFEF